MISSKLLNYYKNIYLVNKFNTITLNILVVRGILLKKSFIIFQDQFPILYLGFILFIIYFSHTIQKNKN